MDAIRPGAHDTKSATVHGNQCVCMCVRVCVCVGGGGGSTPWYTDTNMVLPDLILNCFSLLRTSSGSVFITVCTCT